LFVIFIFVSFFRQCCSTRRIRQKSKSELFIFHAHIAIFRLPLKLIIALNPAVQAILQPRPLHLRC
jgi:hypothetical protein